MGPMLRTAMALTLLGSFARQSAGQAGETPQDLKIAFVGDTEVEGQRRQVLELIKREGANAMVDGGDLAYTDDFAAWEGQLDEILGVDFPYFPVVGNHEVETAVNGVTDWRRPGGFQDRYRARLARLGIAYDGDPGVRSALYYKGILLLQIAAGIGELRRHDPNEVPPDGPFYADYIEQATASSGAIWRVTSMHRVMNEMQLGAKGSQGCDSLFADLMDGDGDVPPEVNWSNIFDVPLPDNYDDCRRDPDDSPGWEVYEASRRAGAIMGTAHEHSYSRTHTMSSFRRLLHEPPTANRDDVPTLTLAADDPLTSADDGRSFAFVSGLGGREGLGNLDGPRSQDRDGAWWGSRYTEDQDGRWGVLFGVFNFGGDPRLAYFYFKNIDGTIVDEFFVRSRVGGDATLRVNASGAGQVELAPAGGRYALGTQVTLRAMPHGGVAAGFLGWEGDLSGTEPVTTVTVTRDMSIDALFSRPVIVQARIASSRDDAEEDDEDVETEDDDLDFSGDRWVGLRFDRLAIPTGVRVVNAYVRFASQDDRSSRLRVQIYGEAVDSAARFQERDRDLSRRPHTAGVPWDTHLWVEGQSGQHERTPDLTPIVQAVVSRPGWRPGAALALLFLGTRDDDGERDAVSFDDSRTDAPMLVVEYLPSL